MGGTAPTDIASLASGVDFSAVGLGVLAVAGLLMSVYVIVAGVKFVIRQVRGA
ncbi:hypothetical protein D3C81_444130 [compost metagenome]